MDIFIWFWRHSIQLYFCLVVVVVVVHINERQLDIVVD